MNIEFESLDHGVRIHDRIESTTYQVKTGNRTFETGNTDVFRVPVTRALQVETDELVFPNPADVFVREGSAVTLDVPAGERDAIGRGTYEIDVSSAPMKLYTHIEGAAVTIDSREGATAVLLDETRTVSIGVRSRHDHPAGSITVRDRPRDLMRAVSAFGSALKTTSPERSFPTMRGHPPTVERGSSFAIPDNVVPPETNVRLEVPERYDAVYSVATLAYYLGAEVVPGTTPRIVAGRHTFDFPYDDIARSANHLLRHCFTLDCIVRTEGIYPVNLAECETILERTDLDLAGLYDASLAERTATYLDIPLSATNGVLEWHLTTDVTPTSENAEILPYLVNDLSFLRSPAPTTTSTSPEPEPEAVTEFFRDGSCGAFSRSVEPSSSVRAADGDVERADRIVSPSDAETVGHAWVGDDYPVGASKPTVASYKRRLDRQAEQDATIDVHVVCNDPEMREEAEDLYGFRDMIEFDIETDFDLSVEETRAVLESDTDLLHFIGHITEDGIQCRDDEYLDVRDITNVNVDVFILNGCRSYAQGMDLVEAGALGGVVTLDNVYNHVATDIGRSVARLLDNGFDLHGALSVATENVATGYQYSIVGNGGVTLCQHHGGCPKVGVIDVDAVTDESIAVSIRDYLTRDFGPGSFSSPMLSTSSARYLSSPADHTFEVDRDRFENALSSGRTPILFDGQLCWSDELDLSEL